MHLYHLLQSGRRLSLYNKHIPTERPVRMPRGADQKEELTMKDTMCGLVKEVNAPSGLVYHTDLPIPEINDDEVLIKVHCSAICGTDLHIMEWDEWSQKRIKAPVTVGHETARRDRGGGKKRHGAQGGRPGVLRVPYSLAASAISARTGCHTSART